MRKNNWYQRCRAEIEKIYGDDADLFCGLLAATSPRKQVKANWRLAERIYELYKIYGSVLNVNQGITGLMPCHVPNVIRALYGKPLSGRKVRNFYKALCGDLSVVVVDVWIGRFYGYEKITNEVYDHIEWVIKERAAIIGMEPAELQAELWCRVIESHGKIPKSYLAAIDRQMKFNFGE